MLAELVLFCNRASSFAFSLGLAPGRSVVVAACCCGNFGALGLVEVDSCEF